MAHRYRVVPTGDVEAQVLAHGWDDRAIWNVAVEQFRMWRPGRPSSPNVKERSDQLTEAREHIVWLREGSSSVQQQALRIFGEAVKNFFAGTHGRPRFRGRHAKLGFTVRDVKVRKLNRRWAEIQIPKHGTHKKVWVRFRLSRPLPAQFGMARITRDRAGRWHVSFSAPQPEVEKVRTGAVLGVDRGVVNTAAYSEPVAGSHFSHVSGLRPKEAERKLRLERQKARQQKGSKRWRRTKQHLARLSAREAGRAKDFVEKTTTQLVRGFDMVALEDLRVRQMMASAKGTVAVPGRNVRAKSGLNRGIAGSRWSMFARRLQDKAQAAASPTNVVYVSAANTSRTCRACGNTVAKSREGQAAFVCCVCGHAAHADVQAAQTIRERGIAKLLASAPGDGVAARRDLGVGRSKKREPQGEPRTSEAA